MGGGGNEFYDRAGQERTVGQDSGGLKPPKLRRSSSFEKAVRKLKNAVGSAIKDSIGPHPRSVGCLSRRKEKPVNTGGDSMTYDDYIKHHALDELVRRALTTAHRSATQDPAPVMAQVLTGHGPLVFNDDPALGKAPDHPSLLDNSILFLPQIATEALRCAAAGPVRLAA